MKIHGWYTDPHQTPDDDTETHREHHHWWYVTDYESFEEFLEDESRDMESNDVLWYMIEE